MRNKQTLYIDQNGSRWWAKTVKELRNQIGYVIGQHWLTAYQPVERQL